MGTHIQEGDTAAGDLTGTYPSPTLDPDRARATETSTTTATMSDDVELHECNGSSNYVLTLPAHKADKIVTVTNINTGIVTLTPTSGTIFGEATELLYQYEALVIKSDGTNWEIGG